MKEQLTTIAQRTIVIASFLLLIAMTPGLAQTVTQQQNASEPTPSQPAQADQMLGPLNLTQDQMQKIRAINAELKDERQASNQRLRIAQRALAEAIQSPTPDETLIAERSKEVADAQANTIRLRSLTEARVLQVLTPEQRIKLRELRQQNQARRREQTGQGGNQQFRQAIMGRRQGAAQRNANANAPLGPRQRKLMRQQQQKP